MKHEIKTMLTNLITVILGLEIKGFFDKGGSNNDLAFTILKILFLSLFSVCIINMEDVTRVIIHKIEGTMNDRENNGVLSLTKLLKPSGLTK